MPQTVRVFSREENKTQTETTKKNGASGRATVGDCRFFSVTQKRKTGGAFRARKNEREKTMTRSNKTNATEALAALAARTGAPAPAPANPRRGRPRKAHEAHEAHEAHDERQTPAAPAPALWNHKGTLHYGAPEPAPAPSAVRAALEAAAGAERREAGPALPGTGPARERVVALRAALEVAFPERRDAIAALIVGAVAGQHVLLLGPPGCGKSALVRAFADAAQRSYFEALVGATTTPDDLLGPISLRALADHDRLTRKTAGRLADVEMAFIDEIFKANSKTLNSLLAAMNERIVHIEDAAGVRAAPIPLRQIAAASNELPDARSETLAAFDDRLPLRVVVDRIDDDAAAEAVIFGDARPVIPSLAPRDLEALEAAARCIPVSAALRAAVMAMRADVHTAGVRVSDRRWVAAVAIVRAAAVLVGAPEAGPEHLDILRHVLWSRPEQRAAIDPIVDRHGAPWVSAMSDIVAEIEKLRADVERAAKITARGERIVTVGGIVARIADLRASIAADLVGAPSAEIERVEARAAALADAADAALVAR